VQGNESTHTRQDDPARQWQTAALDLFELQENGKMNLFVKFVYSYKHDCQVEVIGRGHFEQSIMIKLPDGRIVETDANDLWERKHDTDRC
jgi:hypothetical protein